MIPIVGLTGYRRTGKSSVADVLVAEFGFTAIGISDPLKAIARAIGWDGTKAEGHQCAECGMAQGRLLLQLLGTEGLRTHISPTVWTEVLQHRIDEVTTPVVVADVRYANEADVLRAMGAEIWRVHRQGTAADDHPSERMVDAIKPDHHLYNFSTLDDLAADVRFWMGERCPAS